MANEPQAAKAAPASPPASTLDPRARGLACFQDLMAGGNPEAGTLSFMMNGDIGDRRALKALAMMTLSDAKAFCAEMAKDKIGDIHAPGEGRDESDVLVLAKHYLEQWADLAANKR